MGANKRTIGFDFIDGGKVRYVAVHNNLISLNAGLSMACIKSRSEPDAGVPELCGG